MIHKIYHLLTNFKSNHTIFLLLSFFFYATMVGLWHIDNNSLPTSDAAAYLNDAYVRYNVFFEKGFLAGFVELYSSRAWRPQIFSIFITPFLLLFGSNPLNSVLIISTLCAGLLSAYVYLILRLHIKPFLSFLAAIFILSFSFIYNIYVTFFSEIIYLPLILASFYYLIKSENFTNLKYAKYSAICIALTLCIRPAEAILFVFAILPFLISSLKAKTITFNDIFFCLNAIFTTVILLFYITYIMPHEKPYLWFSLLFVILILYWVVKFYKSSAYPSNILIKYTSIICIIVFVYWVPAIDKLLNWSIEASSGSVVQSLAWHLKTSSFIPNLVNGWKEILAALLYCTPILLFKSNYRNIFNENIIKISLVAILPLTVLFISYSFLNNDGQIMRRSIMMGLTLAIALASMIFNKNNKLVALPALFLIVLSFFNYNNLLSKSIGSDNHFVSKNITLGNNIMRKINLNWNAYVEISDERPEKHLALISRIKINSCKYDPSDCLKDKNIFLTLPLMFNKNTVDPFATGFANQQYLKNNFWLGFVFIPANVEPYDYILKRHVNYIIVEINKDLNKKMLDYRGSIGSGEKFSASIIREYKLKQFTRTRYLDEFMINGSKYIVLKMLDE
jgi:hypothetical protein